MPLSALKPYVRVQCEIPHTATPGQRNTAHISVMSRREHLHRHWLCSYEKLRFKFEWWQDDNQHMGTSPTPATSPEGVSCFARPKWLGAKTSSGQSVTELHQAVIWEGTLWVWRNFNAFCTFVLWLLASRMCSFAITCTGFHTVSHNHRGRNTQH